MKANITSLLIAPVAGRRGRGWAALELILVGGVVGIFFSIMIFDPIPTAAAFAHNLDGN
jgi:hypothetical protein